MVKSCVGCGRQTVDATMFPCPDSECDAQIVRCKTCRENSVKWVCRKCGTIGP